MSASRSAKTNNGAWGKRPGRPKLPESARKKHRFAVYLDDEEWLTLQLCAAECELDPRVLARELLRDALRGGARRR